jgi:hypothetical protein
MSNAQHHLPTCRKTSKDLPQSVNTHNMGKHTVVLNWSFDLNATFVRRYIGHAFLDRTPIRNDLFSHLLIVFIDAASVTWRFVKKSPNLVKKCPKWSFTEMIFLSQENTDQNLGV